MCTVAVLPPGAKRTSILSVSFPWWKKDELIKMAAQEKSEFFWYGYKKTGYLKCTFSRIVFNGNMGVDLGGDGGIYPPPTFLAAGMINVYHPPHFFIQEVH